MVRGFIHTCWKIEMLNGTGIIDNPDQYYNDKDFNECRGYWVLDSLYRIKCYWIFESPLMGNIGS